MPHRVTAATRRPPSPSTYPLVSRAIGGTAGLLHAKATPPRTQALAPTRNARRCQHCRTRCPRRLAGAVLQSQQQRRAVPRSDSELPPLSCCHPQALGRLRITVATPRTAGAQAKASDGLCCLQLCRSSHPTVESYFRWLLRMTGGGRDVSSQHSSLGVLSRIGLVVCGETENIGFEQGTHCQHWIRPMAQRILEKVVYFDIQRSFATPGVSQAR